VDGLEFGKLELYGDRVILANTTYMLYILIVTGKQIVEILKANGWVLDRISGSHYIMVKDGYRSIPVPVHGSKDLGVWAQKILKEAGIKR